MEKKFKPKQWVLIRDYFDEKWCLAQFSHMDGTLYTACGGGQWTQCIPYKENEKLLGTTNVK